MRTLGKYILFGLALVFIDQALKFMAIRFWPNAVYFNPSGGFGVNFGAERFLPLSIISFAVAAILVFALWKKNDLRIPLVLISSGALGNLIDRLARGGVVDFIDFKIWPSFNFADSIISIGLIWLIIQLFFRPFRQSS